MFRLLSVERKVSDDYTKPETVILAECSGIRERQPIEAVHLRDVEDQDSLVCVVCGSLAGVWFSYQMVDDLGPDAPPESWLKHTMRCC